MANSDTIEIDQKYYRPYYDLQDNIIVYKYSVLLQDNTRYIEISEKYMNAYRINCHNRYMELTQLINAQYNDKYIHISANKLSLADITDTSDNPKSWISPNQKTPLYQNPIGLWFSCGSAWLTWLGADCNKWITRSNYVYEINTTKTVLKISNLIQLRHFAHKYRNFPTTTIKEMIDWSRVKKDYDGLVICPYLGQKIWKTADPTNMGIGNVIVDYIETALDEKVFDVEAFALEWYRHWETATGVVWRPSGIESINLINESNWYAEFLQELRQVLVEDNQRNNDINKSQTQMSRISTTGIRVLTYNVSWQSTSGLKAEWPICNNVDDENNPRHYTKCIQNIAKMIDDNAPYDFVCLQEVANLDKIISASGTLAAMNYVEHQSGPEKIATFWDSTKYKLQENINGSFRTGRPFQILIFRENICLINLHLPHLNKMAVIKNLEYLITKIDPKITNYRFIMAGDFNYAINNPDVKKNFLPALQLFDLKFYINPKYIPTCCTPPFDRNTVQFDHVVDTFDVPVSVTTPVVPELASDHLPILAILNDTAMSRIYRNKTHYYHEKYRALKKKLHKMI